MGHKFADIAFTDQIKKLQQQQGSRAGYANWEQREDFNDVLSQREAQFISVRDSFYMASVSETGWPYVQHRGGPVGFFRVLDNKTLGFADFRGNRQFISTGNLGNNERVSLFLMDYPNKRRLKILGRVTLVDPSDNETLKRLKVDEYDGPVERGFLIHVEAFDWNCPKYITPRFTEADMQPILAPLISENQALKAAAQKTPELFGDGPLSLVISGVRQLTPRVRAYEFRAPDGQELPEVAAGSHLHLPVLLADGQWTTRQYYICSNPSRRDAFEVAVLLQEGLQEKDNGASKAIHQHYQLGQNICCDMPMNDFACHTDERPAVLIAAGIGITAIKAMAQAFETRDIDFVLHYAGRNKKEMAFCERLQRQLGDHLVVYNADENKRMDIGQIINDAPQQSLFYVCGPNSLIDDAVATAAMQGVEPERICFERF